MRVERIAAAVAALVVVGVITCGAVSTRVAARARAAQESQQSQSAQQSQSEQQSQSDAASKTAKFGSIEKTDAVYKGALDAHDLAGALKLVGHEGAFRGTTSKAFEQRDGSLVVLDFDPNFRTALTAVVRRADYAKFPALRDLEGKEVVVTGKFTEFRGRAQIELTDPAQIKIVK